MRPKQPSGTILCEERLTGILARCSFLKFLEMTFLNSKTLLPDKRLHDPVFNLQLLGLASAKHLPI